MFTAIRSLRRGWGLVLRDPLGILGPAAGALWIQSLAALWFWRSLPDAPTKVALWAVLLHGGAVMLATPLRWASLRSAAALLGLPTRGLDGLLPLAGVQLVAGALQATLSGVTAGAGAVLATLLAAQGWWSLGALGLAGSIVASVFLGLVVRVLFAYAPAEALCGGRSGWGSLWRSAVRGRPLGTAALLLGGDVATGLGALLLGAGALPGYPLSDVALLCEWEARR